MERRKAAARRDAMRGCPHSPIAAPSSADTARPPVQAVPSRPMMQPSSHWPVAFRLSMYASLQVGAAPPSGSRPPRPTPARAARAAARGAYSAMILWGGGRTRGGPVRSGLAGRGLGRRATHQDMLEWRFL